MKQGTINKKVLKISEKLPPLTEKQSEYAKSLCEHKAIILKGFAYCLDCGHKFLYEGQDKCPHCGVKYNEIKKSRRISWKKDPAEVMTMITTKNGFQIIRNFYIFKWTCLKHPAKYEIFEVSQWYINDKGEQACIARNRRFMPLYIDDYNYSKPMTIKKKGQIINYTKYSNFRQYHIRGSVYPQVSYLSIFKRNGLHKRIFDLSRTSAHTIFENVLHEPKYETLVKAKRIDIIDSLEIREIRNYWPQIKMCIRHKYYPSDFRLWSDTIRLIQDTEYDDRSPKYVLPENLKATHDLFVKRLDRLLKKKELEKYKKDEAKYISLNKKFFNIVIKHNDITIEPLRSYIDFKEEADKMHHCVMTYLEKSSLILSVKDKEKHIATIELDKSNWQIKQCQGVCNQIPPHRKLIINCMEKNMYLFAKAS